MPYADRQKQLAAMKKWRATHGEQIALYNAEERPKRVITDKERARKRLARHGVKTFVGCDGEGMGDGYDHQYYVWRMGDNQLVTGDPLKSDELLWFIAQQTHGPIYTIFSGNYDFTMILRGLPRETTADLLARPAREREGGHVRPTAYGDLRLDYLPHKRLSVGLAGQPAIVIHDVFGFLQCSFVKAIDEWDIGTPDQRSIVVAGKEARGNTNVLSPSELEYNRVECILLGQLVSKMDDTATSLGITMAPYEGAGALANSLFRVHNTNPIKRWNKEHNDVQPVFASELDPANSGLPTWNGYYGGRFEITAHGPIDRPVYEYDINSAYPHIIRMLPCLWHGRWVHRNNSARPVTNQDALSQMRDHGRVAIGHIRWRSGSMDAWGPLPHRNRLGNVTFPLTGAGWYWSLEWPDDLYTYEVDDIWEWVPSCNHRPFSWVYDRYQQRKAHKAAGRKGQALQLKYGYNSLYGKFVQSIGRAPWRNSVYGGLITAGCRRILRDAASLSPENIVMFATDGIYSLTPLDLEIGDDLGQWEADVFDDGLHLVRPGIYFSPDGEAKIKTRGIGKSVVQANADRIKDTFQRIYDHPEWLTSITGKGIDGWSTPLTYNGLVSLRLAHSQNRPERAGYFGTLPHNLSYDFNPKRVPYDFESFDGNWVDGILRSSPPPIAAPVESVGYLDSKVRGKSEMNDAELDMLESAPDGQQAWSQMEMF